MQVSAWLYLMQQGLCAVCVLTVLGQAAGLGRIYPLRLFFAALIIALSCMLAAQWPALRLPMLLLTWLSPLCAWPNIPRRVRPRLMMLHAVTGLMWVGYARLIYSLPAAPLLQLPLLCVIFCLTPRLFRRCAAPQCISIRISHQGRRFSCTALVDSGNLLRDPLTGLPVIVISRKAAARLLPSLNDLQPGMRLLRVRTIAGSTLMSILRPEHLELSLDNTWITSQAMVGLSPDGYDGYQALVPSRLITAASELSSIRNKEEITS